MTVPRIAKEQHGKIKTFFKHHTAKQSWKYIIIKLSLYSVLDLLGRARDHGQYLNFFHVWICFLI